MTNRVRVLTLNTHGQVQDLLRSSKHGAARPSSEYISLESEPEYAKAPSHPPRNKVRASYTLNSRLRGCTNEVSILDDHFLHVRCSRPDTEPKPYVFDLRFVNAKPVRVRKISWLWLAIALVLGGTSAIGAWLAMTSPGFTLRLPALLAAAVTLLTGVAGFVMFLRFTTESLEFTSVHGEATLVSITGGIGSARAGRKFFVELIKNINAAKNARKQAKQQWLRDEMREHHRLRELGILSEEQYEASKARILAAHS